MTVVEHREMCDVCTPLGFGHRQKPGEAAQWVPSRREWLCEHCRSVLVVPERDGLYPDIPDHVYHGDRDSLSSSGARRLLPPSCPAIYRWEQEQPPKPLPQFDVGKAAHKMILGVGERIVRVDAENWTTKAARAMRDQAHADGHTPMLAADLDAAQRMAGAVHSHPTAGPLLESGRPEMSGYWHDPETGVRLRFRPDWWSEPRHGCRVVVDVKTSVSADPQDFRSAAARYGYHVQAAWYLTGTNAVDPDVETAFVFVVVAKQPPYPVSVIELEAAALDLGARQMRRAVDCYASCLAVGQWPGYGEGVHTVDLPRWAYMNEPA